MMPASAASPPFKVHALGEIAIRCTDLAAMVAFYRDIVGLELLAQRNEQNIHFFRIAPGYGGHTTVLALFAAQMQVATGLSSSLHHIALTVDASDQEDVMAWLDKKSVAYNVQLFGWVGWRGVFMKDPDGNTVEFVAYDDAFRAKPSA